MTERARLRLRLGVIAIAVLAIHVWLLGGMPRVIAPLKRAAPLVARTLKPPPVERPAEPAPPLATRPEARVAPPPPAPRKQAAPRAPAAPVPAPETSTTPPTAATPSREPSPPTQSAGAAAASHFAVAPSARYHYDVVAQLKGLMLKGQAELDWRNQNGEYQAQLQMSSPLPFLKPRIQRSSGLVTPDGLAPLRFSDKVRSEEAAHFDRDQAKVTFSTNKPEAPLEAGAQDRLSIVMQLGAMLAGNPSKFPEGSQITLQTASTKEAEPWTFTVEGSETLDLPGGRTAAVRLTRNPRKEYDVKVELWLAPGAAYAPVRLRLTQPNGDWVDQQWSWTDRG